MSFRWFVFTDKEPKPTKRLQEKSGKMEEKQAARLQKVNFTPYFYSYFIFFLR
ncbi:hypothetical protein HMPREF9151_00844 [Hoylesella saccharolytica F0055]|uniref:Uncharacterized protein n=1 Tax=Hoylesella saccharolytica F0055 TaxID=1127699 RepID=L1NF14_9BACT|nr:hypothetical protein HMPREF9151_00844 [Hoylesella saccharolytica F0055]